MRCLDEKLDCARSFARGRKESGNWIDAFFSAGKKLLYEDGATPYLVVMKTDSGGLFTFMFSGRGVYEGVLASRVSLWGF